MAVGTPKATKAPRSFREELDRVLTAIRRGLAFWKRSLAVFVVVSLAAFAIVMVAPRSYKSETVILYQDTMRSGDLMAGDNANDNARRVGARLREVLLSRAVLEPLVTELKLYPEMVARRGLVDAVDEMRKHVTFRAREGDTFEIAFESDNPERTQDVTRRLAECIVQEAASRRAEQAKVLKEFLGAESERNKAELRTKEGELAKFLVLHPEFARPTTSDIHSAAPATTAPSSATTGGDPMLAALEWKASRIERQLKMVGGKVDPPPPPKPSHTEPKPLPDSAELVAARRDVEDKAGRFTEKHPDVIAARARLRAAEAAQAASQAAANQAAAAEASAHVDEPPLVPATVENRDALTKQLEDLKIQIASRRAAGAVAGGPGNRRRTEAPTPTADNHGGSVDLEVEFRRLQREATDARERQHQLDDKSFKASISASSVMNDRNVQVLVLDAAYLPTHPTSLPRSTKLALGLFIALALSILTALVSVRLDDRIHDRVDLELLGVLPVLGVIPRVNALPRKSG